MFTDLTLCLVLTALLTCVAYLEVVCSLGKISNLKDPVIFLIEVGGGVIWQYDLKIENQTKYVITV